jgi:hypothetical protein
MSKNQSCSSCYFWSRNRWPGGQEVKVETKGECLRYPPTPLGSGGYGFSYQFPEVRAYQWCGEWTLLQGNGK